jgi:hypothetical protein
MPGAKSGLRWCCGSPSSVRNKLPRAYSVRRESDFECYGGPIMRYRVYSGPKGCDDVTPTTKDKLLFKEYTTLDEALSWARHVERDGRIPLLIEGDDGTQMDRRSIVNALRVGMREDVGRQTAPMADAARR